MKNQYVKFIAVLVALLFSVQAASAARTDLTVKTLTSLRAGTISANAADFTFVGSNSADGYSFTTTGKELVIAYNSDDTDPGTVTVVSVADENGRTGDNPSAYTLAAGEYAVFGPYPMGGWRQTTGKIHINATIDEIKFVVIRLP